MKEQFRRRIEGPEAMLALGRELAEQLTGRETLALCGDLGAGKTQLVKGLAAGLGFEEAVTSPTFPLVQEYHGGRCPLFHFDFYRLENAAEARALDFEEMLGTGIVAVEWAERFPELLPPDTHWLHIQILSPEVRVVEEMDQPG